MLAAFTGVVVWFGHQIHDFLMPPSDAITVPSFVGQTLADANASAQRIHLTGTVIDRTIEEVFAFVADQMKAPRWQKGLLEVRRTKAHRA